MIARPGLEPARLVVDAVAGQSALGNQAEDPPVIHQCAGIEHRLVVPDREPDADDDALGVPRDLAQHFRRRVENGGREKHVFATVTADAELGQTQDAHALGLRLRDHIQDVFRVGVPGEGRLVESRGGDFDESHLPQTSRSSWELARAPNLGPANGGKPCWAPSSITRTGGQGRGEPRVEIRDYAGDIWARHHLLDPRRAVFEDFAIPARTHRIRSCAVRIATDRPGSAQRRAGQPFHLGESRRESAGHEGGVDSHHGAIERTSHTLGLNEQRLWRDEVSALERSLQSSPEEQGLRQVGSEIADCLQPRES